MIDAGSGLKFVVATRPADLRKGRDGLVAVVEYELGPGTYPEVMAQWPSPRRMKTWLEW